jgi:mono/diheme cytochrome c family protein
MSKRNWFLLVPMAVALGAPGLQAQSAVAAPDLPSGAMQAKATTACTECHESRIILQQRLSKSAWTKEVDKMSKWGAVVDPKDRDALIEYLSNNFGTDRPAYVPDRSSSSRPSKK